jgi:hypothetical protein
VAAVPIASQTRIKKKNSKYTALRDWMVVKIELERMWKEKVAELELLSWSVFGGADEIKKKKN